MKESIWHGRGILIKSLNVKRLYTTVDEIRSLNEAPKGKRGEQVISGLSSNSRAVLVLRSKAPGSAAFQIWGESVMQDFSNSLGITPYDVFYLLDMELKNLSLRGLIERLPAPIAFTYLMLVFNPKAGLGLSASGKIYRAHCNGEAAQ